MARPMSYHRPCCFSGQAEKALTGQATEARTARGAMCSLTTSTVMPGVIASLPSTPVPVIMVRSGRGS